jgi:hypothetical protein
MVVSGMLLERYWHLQLILESQLGRCGALSVLVPKVLICLARWAKTEHVRAQTGIAYEVDSFCPELAKLSQIDCGLLVR